MSHGGVLAAGGRRSTRPYFTNAEWMWVPIPASPVLDSNNTAIKTALATGQHSIALAAFATNLVHPSEVSAATPRYDITFANQIGGSSGQNWGPDPFGTDTMPIPDGTETGIPPGDFGYVDGHISAGDPTRGQVYSLWQATASGSPTRVRGASWGAMTGLYGDGRETDGNSSTGARLSRFGCVVREAEISAARIPHALFFGTDMVTIGDPGTPSSWVYPAAGSDGSNDSGSSTTIKEGTRVQLDPSVNLAGISGIGSAELAIGRALQTYGAYCGDNSGARMSFVMEYIPGGSSIYTSAGLSEYMDMTHIPWSSLRVLARWDGR
jgi:hypothetical protein